MWVAIITYSYTYIPINFTETLANAYECDFLFPYSSVVVGFMLTEHISLFIPYHLILNTRKFLFYHM